jgi:TPR repeat protein
MTELEQIRAEAEQGDAVALNTLGVMYYDGDGVEKDYTEAVSYFRKAEALGNADAQQNLGQVYYHGHGVPIDYMKSIEWFTKAAANGSAQAKEIMDNFGKDSGEFYD